MSRNPVLPPAAFDGKFTFMRAWIVNRPIVIAVLLGPLLAFLLWSAAFAQTGGNDRLDRLFAQLRMAPDADAANLITQQIWVEWTTPDDPALATRMDEILRHRASQDIAGAITELNDLVADYPQYAEGWNQLATLHYIVNDYDASLANIEKVLQLEPRHFGALTGRAMIHRFRGEQALAIKDMAAALELHPFLAERALFPELLEDITRI